MRFIEYGLDIPDELLLALDEGKVMFFCGAGVSQQNAGLPDFLCLAKKVLERLRVSKGDPADQILKLARNEPTEKTEIIEGQFGVSNFVSADLIFSELEKDFDTQDIETAVAKALNPPKGVCLKAHKIMLDLSKTKAGYTRLVTTNFDRLFEKSDDSLNVWQPPHLPDLSQISTFQGVVYLHGAANKKYNNSDSRFILSSAEFGRAYLAEGWATQFFKEIVSKYTVVFVGYAADDPPVRYLLEALKKDATNKIYAFELGTQKDAEKKWQNKGKAIAYDNYAQLWQTLEAWAERTKDIKVWQDGIIKMARKGPRQLSPFQREQVVQFVLTKEGAQSFCTSNNPPPASWLCVFDKTVRFERPYPMIQDDGSPYSFDLFERYKLDSDTKPEYIDPNDYLTDRNIPKEALDVFAVNNRDKNEIQNNPVVPMRGENALSNGNLPARLSYLGEWIAKISNQNITVWWVASQDGIHPYVQRRIKYLLQDKTGCALHILHAWQYIFDNWTPKPDDMGENGLEWHSFEKNVEKFGWGKPTIRRYEELTKPRMLTKARFLPSAMERPQPNKKIDFTHLVELSIPYNDYPPDIKIPDECLAQIVAVWRRNIDTRIRLETEKGYHTMSRPLITQNPQRDQILDLIDIVLYYTSFLKILLEFNPRQARAEIKNWDNKDDDIYNRLRLWSCQFSSLVSKGTFARSFSAMSRDFFWNGSYQHDLCHVIKTRWSDISAPTKRAIEKRILQGRKKDKNEKQCEYILHKTELTLARLDWLKDNGCVLGVATETQMARLKMTTPTYTPEHAKDIDRSTEGTVQMMSTNNDPSVLLELPIADILPKAQEAKDRRYRTPSFNDPFAGLYETRPARALSALRYQTIRGNFTPWDWLGFLQDEKRKDDPVWMKKLIAELIMLMPDRAVVEIMYGASYWLLSASKQLPSANVPIFEQLIKRLIEILHKNHKNEDFTVKSRETNRSWGNEALNRSAGHIAQTLFNDPRIKGLKAGEIFPCDWLDLVESTLNMPNDQGRWALLFFTHNLPWLHKIDPKWTDDKILQPLLDGNADTTDAWWAGYIWGARQSPAPALFAKIKPHLLAWASHQYFKKKNSTNVIITLILSNWHHNSKNKNAWHILDKDIHKVLLNSGDDFRARFLRVLQEYCKNEDATCRRWKNKRNHLINNVWPLQKRIKTPKTSGGLIELAFSDEQAFPRLTKTILPLLGENPQVSMSSFLYGANKDHIIDKHPKIVLEILYKIVPEDDFLISYRIKQMLDRIATADPKLKHDPRFIELAERCDLG